MSNKRSNIITGIRIMAMIVLQALLYRNRPIEHFLTAVGLTAICFWVLPWCLSQIIFSVFKLKDDFGGTLLFDDSDPTDCRFRMVFSFEPEDLVKEPTFTVKCERANIRDEKITRD